MKYYIAVNTDSVFKKDKFKDIWIEDSISSKELGMYLLNKTNVLPIGKIECTVEISNINQKDFLSSNKLWGIFSKVMVQKIDCLSKLDNFEVSFEQNSIKKQFNILKIPIISNSVDEIKSNIEVDPIFNDAYGSIKEIYFKDNDLPSIFYLYEKLDILVVDDEFRNKWIKGKGLGLKFISAQFYDSLKIY